MLLSSLRLKDYRNYRQLYCEFCPGVNLFTGANAQGKTNLVESIYYLSIGRAYRQARDEQLILWGGRSFQIKGKIERRQGTTEIEARYDKDENPAKVILVDGLRQTKWEEVSGRFTSVLFSPESMAIIKGSPQERRGFLNYDIGQISLTYGVNLYKYMRLLAQRNALLKKLSPLAMPLSEKKDRLSVWDQQMIVYGGGIVEKRMAIIERLTPMVRLIHRRLTDSGDNMELQYLMRGKKPVPIKKGAEKTWSAAGLLQELCDDSLEEDLRFGSTQWGPHRDDLRILLDGVDMKLYGSQGQQRTGVLALKLAELEIFRGESGEYPVLLLDDVMSELDDTRQRKLIRFISEKSIQCVITSTDVKNVDLIEKRQIKRFFVNRGEIKEI